MKIKLSKLKLADKVRLFEGAYGDATVCKIEDGVVHFIRPYIHTGNFSCTAGVLTYFGHEDCSRMITSQDTETVELLGRSDTPLK